MRNKSLPYSITVLIVYSIVMLVFWPAVLPAIFLAATLTVGTVAILGGLRLGILAYIIVTAVLVYLPIVEILGINESISRFVGFTITSIFLSVLGTRHEKAATEAKLQESRITVISDSLTDVLITINERSIITFVNPAIEPVFGWKPEEIISKSLTTLMPERLREPHRKGFKKYLQTNIKTLNWKAVEVLGLRKDGTEFPIEISFGEFLDKEVRYFSAIIRDISSRKATERETLLSQERYKAFIQNSDEAIWLIEYTNPVAITFPPEEQIELLLAEGVITEANEQTAKLYNVPPDTIIGMPTSKLAPRTPKSDEFLKQFITNKYNVIKWESETKDATGKTRFGETSFKGIVEDGKIVRAWVIQRDTTEARFDEVALLQSQERYKAFIETNENAIWRVEFEEPLDVNLSPSAQTDLFFNKGYIAEANEATARILDVDYKSSLLNKPLHKVAPRTPNDNEFIAYFIQHGYMAQDYETTDTVRGRTVHYSTSMMGIVEEGKWLRAWLVRRDITVQKNSIIERETALEDTRKAKKALEIASVEKDRFLANLSHELRTPLVSILGYSALLMETETTGEAAKKMITTINKSAEFQVHLIEDLLDLSRIIAGKVELEKDFFDCTDMVRESVNTIRKQTSLTIVEDYEDCTFYGDKRRMTQVLLNLINNAVKFTDEGQITVSLRCSEEFLIIKIRDTGIGIHSNNFSKLFQPFTQLDSSSIRTTKGLGLGLSIVKNIVELHGGTVSVESSLGEGTEFTTYFPVVEAESIKKPEKVSDVPSTTSFKGISMLVVEDDSDSADFLGYFYEQKGAKVVWAISAKKAREEISKNKYDLYIFDLSMPEEDGISLIKSVRKAGDETKAVALTAFADDMHEKMALDAGFDMFLKKPSSLPALLNVVRLLDPIDRTEDV